MSDWGIFVIQGYLDELQRYSHLPFPKPDEKCDHIFIDEEKLVPLSEAATALDHARLALNLAHRLVAVPVWNFSLINSFITELYWYRDNHSQFPPRGERLDVDGLLDQAERALDRALTALRALRVL
jgi:hypothetical protein